MNEKDDNADKTKRVFIRNGHIDASKHFPHLGLYTSYHLRDDMDIGRRIAQANQTMGCM